jgi:hypothetical protein
VIRSHSDPDFYIGAIAPLKTRMAKLQTRSRVGAINAHLLLYHGIKTPKLLQISRLLLSEEGALLANMVLKVYL